MFFVQSEWWRTKHTFNSTRVVHNQRVKNESNSFYSINHYDDKQRTISVNGHDSSSNPKKSEHKRKKTIKIHNKCILTLNGRAGLSFHSTHATLNVCECVTKE